MRGRISFLINRGLFYFPFYLLVISIHMHDTRKRKNFISKSSSWIVYSRRRNTITFLQQDDQRRSNRYSIKLLAKWVMSEIILYYSMFTFKKKKLDVETSKRHDEKRFSWKTRGGKEGREKKKKENNNRLANEKAWPYSSNPTKVNLLLALESHLAELSWNFHLPFAIQMDASFKFIKF